MTTARRALCLMLVSGLGGCHLIDQRDFDAQAGRPPAKPAVIAPAPPPGPPALMTIKFDQPNPPYQAALEQAVQRAMARKHDVLFTVLTRVPTSSADTLADGAATGRDVAQAIVDAGAASGQVEQAVRAEPGLPAKDVRILVQ